VTEFGGWSIPATPVNPEDLTLTTLITRELQRAGVEVMGVDPPGEYVRHWRATIHGGGDKAVARQVLARIAGVRDVRPSAVSGSIICFDVDRPEPPD